jgi:hypothetical protein
MNTTCIIRHTERLDTIAIRLAYTHDRDARRDELIDAFKAMCTDIGKLATQFRRADWNYIQTRVSELRWNAVKADEARVATFAQVGTEAALVTSLHAFAAVLGFTLADAATASDDTTNPDDETARDAVEGQWKDAAE